MSNRMKIGEPQLTRRKSFECWKIYAMTKLSRQRAIRKAIYSYNVRLKQKAFNSLLRNYHCIEPKRAQSLCCASLSTVSNECSKFRAAEDLRRKIIFKRVFRAWSLYSRNRRRNKCLNAIITKLRDEFVLGRYIQNWKLICFERKRSVEFEEKAIAFYRDFLLRKSLRLWMEGHSHMLHEKKIWKVGIIHYNRKLSNKICHAWIKYCNLKIERANRIAETRKFCESKILERYFSALVSNVSRAIAERALHESAMNFYASRLLRRSLLFWINNHRQRIELERKIEIRCQKMVNALKDKTLRQWWLYVWRKKCSRRKDKNATNHYKRKLAAAAIAVTKRYVFYRRKKMASLRYLQSGIARISLTMEKVYIGKWRIAVIHLARERQKIRRAEEHWSARTITHCFFIWTIFSERHKVEAKRKKKLSEIGKSVILNEYLSRWRTKYAVAAAIINETRAATNYSRKIKSRLFESWKKYIDEKTKRKMEINVVLRDTPRRRIDRFESVERTSVEDSQIARKFFNRWLAFVYDNEDGGIPSRNIAINAYQIPYSTRLVLPEYMRMKTIDSREFVRSHLPFESSSRSRSVDRSTSRRDTSSDSSLATYIIPNPLYD